MTTESSAPSSAGRMASNPKSLRRRLFGSHLQVMFVALLVMVLGGRAVVGLLELVGERTAFGLRDGDGGPVGLLAGLVAAATAAGLVSWRVSRRLAAPLESIRAVTHELAAGRYDVVVPGTDTVELDELANDVNALAEQLRTTEERRLRLIGDVAHELRNPLSTIEGTMEALLDGVIPADPETFARIGRESARLRRLADDLSSLSSAAELGSIDAQPVDLVELVDQAVAQLRPQAEAKGLVFDVTAEAPVVVNGDRDRLMQVLMNVIGNAVQYTEVGRIAVRVVPGPPTAIDVTDTGVGLSTEDQRRVFERFHRVDAHFTDGTGVGLAISKLIVEAHGGSITASSEGEGHGSTFRISLPRR